MIPAISYQAKQGQKRKPAVADKDTAWNDRNQWRERSALQDSASEDTIALPYSTTPCCVCNLFLGLNRYFLLYLAMSYVLLGIGTFGPAVALG